MKAVAGSLIPPLFAASLGCADNVVGQQALDRDEHRALAQACAMVKHVAGARGDAARDLTEGNGVTPLLEAKGAADDVEQHLQLGARQRAHQLIEEFIGHLRIVGAPKALKLADHIRRRWTELVFATLPYCMGNEKATPRPVRTEHPVRPEGSFWGPGKTQGTGGTPRTTGRKTGGKCKATAQKSSPERCQ